MRVITVRGQVEVINHNAGRGNLRVHNQHLLVYDTLTLFDLVLSRTVRLRAVPVTVSISKVNKLAVEVHDD